ncbi:unnamed protein product [Rotaria sordida]|uniref:Uncharacterized protein n=1 Tax=Rotaria sordida TaxID=392033 RepID=A0A815XUF0_9BILA|nr:unnamed protein product [Rotaria sordida]CAF1561723.1 unnamed protein product [Rotaria sordida]
MTSSEFYNNLIISSIFPFKTNKQPTKSKTLRHTFLDGLALLLNGSNKCTSVYPLLKEKKILITCNESLKNDDKIYFDEFFGLIREYSQYCLTSNRHDMKKIYLLLESIIFEYNKNKSIKRITDDLFNDVVSNLKKLSNANVDDLCQKITYGKLKKGSPEYYYLKQKNILLKEFILKLYNWIDYIISNRHAIKNNKNNVELEIILKFQVIGELLYNSEIFRSILSKVYSIEYQDRFIENKFVEYDSSLKLSTCLHSEIRMIDYLIEQNIKEVYDNDVEIGISKLPCYLCSLYIAKLNGDLNRTFYIGSLRTNEKIYPNWMFRNNEKDKIIDDIHNQLYTFIKNEVQLLQLRIRNKSGDSDMQDTEIGDDDDDNFFVHVNMNDKENP